MDNQDLTKSPSLMVQLTTASIFLVLGACGLFDPPPASSELANARETAVEERERWKSIAPQAGLDQEPLVEQLLEMHRKAEEEADNGNTEAAIENHRQAARLARDAMTFASAIENDSMRDVLVYRNEYPNGYFIDRLDETLWSMAIDRHDANAYDLYLAINPDGAYVNEAVHKLDALGAEERAAMRKLAEAPGSDRETNQPAGFDRIHLPPRDTALPNHAQQFRETVREIVVEQDLPSLMSLLTDNVQVSFGGMEGHADFVRHWNLDAGATTTRLWDVLEALMIHPPAFYRGNPAMPDKLVWPYYFSEWPHQRNAFDYLFASDRELPIRADASHSARIVHAISHEAVLIQDHDRACVPSQCEWIFVEASNGITGYVHPPDGWRSIVGYRLIAWFEKDSWKITALIAGD